MGIIRDSFVMFKNWAEAIEALPEEYQLECFKAVSKYGLTGEIPEGLSPIAKALLISFSIGMENNIARYHASVENGKKGGRPKKKNLEKPKETCENPNEFNKNLEKPKKTQVNLDEPNPNLNVNVNVNDNVNVIKLVHKKNKNIFSEYNSARTRERVKERTAEERQPYINFYKEFFDLAYDKWQDTGLEIIDTIIEAKEQSMSEERLTFKQKKYDLKTLSELLACIDVERFRKIVTQLVFNEDIKNRPIYILGCLITAALEVKHDN